jgi:oxygen-independent coproporphyrinogen-3 oxidase
MAPRVRGAYVHIPFCDALCPFCPYNKQVGSADDALALAAVLVDEIKRYRRWDCLAPQLDFVYFGGGTPSVMPAAGIGAILRELRPGPAAEVTLEVNPGTIDEGRLREYRRVGVTRLSFGVQSFQDRHLQRIGSHHSVADSLGVLRAARLAGFENVGIDLMFRLPGQTLVEWQDDLTIATQLDLDHISAYSMVLDPSGGLGRDIASAVAPPQPSEELDLAMSNVAFQILRRAGFHHYASCASCGHDFARSDRESSYERLHWAAPQAEYLGIGPGAYGYIGKTIYCNEHSLSRYVSLVRRDTSPVVAYRELGLTEQMARYFVLGVKCIAVALRPFELSFGRSASDYFARQFAWLTVNGLAEISDDSLILTDTGVLYMDNISKHFYTDEMRLVPQPLEEDMIAFAHGLDA